MDKQKKDMGDRPQNAWKMGKIDALTGLRWNDGLVSTANRPGIHIKETIGGDDVSDYASFRLTKAATIQIETQGAIAQLLNARLRVMADSSDSYSSRMTVSLQPETYYLGFSSESSIAAQFTSLLSFVP